MIMKDFLLERSKRLLITEKNFVEDLRKQTNFLEEKIMTLEEKITELQTLMNEQAELADQMEALKDEVKAELTNQGVSELEIGDFNVKYTKYISHQFDRKAFKAEHENLYEEFSKEVPAVRLTLN